MYDAQLPPPFQSNQHREFLVKLSASRMRLFLPVASDFYVHRISKLVFMCKISVFILWSHLFNLHTTSDCPSNAKITYFSKRCFSLWNSDSVPYTLTKQFTWRPFTHKAKHAHNRSTEIVNFLFGKGSRDANHFVDRLTASGQTIERCFSTTSQSIRTAQTALSVLQHPTGSSLVSA